MPVARRRHVCIERTSAALRAAGTIRDRAAAGAVRGGHQALRRRRRGRAICARHLRGRVLRAARPVGLRQDHAAAHARRLRDAGRGPHPARRRGHRGGAAAPAAGQHDVPELRAVSAPDRRGQHRLRAEAGRLAEGARSRRASRRCWRWCSSKASARASRTSSPAASASAWRWPARWSSGRTCCCSTSRSRRSTRSCARRRSSS